MGAAWYIGSVVVLAYLLVGCFTTWMKKETPLGTPQWKTVVLWPKYLH